MAVMKWSREGSPWKVLSPILLLLPLFHSMKPKSTVVLPGGFCCTKTVRFLSNQTDGTVQEVSKGLQYRQENCILGKCIVVGITDYC